MSPIYRTLSSTKEEFIMARWLGWVFGAALILVTASALAVSPGITFIGKGTINLDIDKSGLAGNICRQSNAADCVPQAVFGGVGSALAYTGHDNVFIAAPDR